MQATIDNVELRSFENRNNKNNEPYGILNFEDENYVSHRMMYKDMSLNEKLRNCRGKSAMLVINVELGQYANVMLLDVIING